MNKKTNWSLLFFIVAGILILICLIIYSNKPQEKVEGDLGILLLKPSEATPKQIREIRDNGYNGLIVVPETMEIYGKTEDLYKYQDDLQRIAGSWMLD